MLVNSSGAAGVLLLEDYEKLRGRFLFELRSKFQIGRYIRKHYSPEQCINVKAGASDDYRHSSILQNTRTGFLGESDEIMRGKYLPRVGDVEQVVRHAAHLAFRYLARTDVETFVYLPRIGRNYLAIESARELDCKCTLSGGRRPDDNQYLLLLFYQVPGERLELSHLAIHDFESCASTNSAIPASPARNFTASVRSLRRRRSEGGQCAAV